MSSDLSSPSRGQRALAAIVVTDVAGNTPASVDQENVVQLIHRDLAVMTRYCEAFEGQVLKSAGNGLLMYFVSAVQAVNCAIAIQKALANSFQSRPSHRIGIHMGDVFFDRSDVVGDSVTMAARLQTQAPPGGICLSQLVYDLVKVRRTLGLFAFTFALLHFLVYAVLDHGLAWEYVVEDITSKERSLEQLFHSLTQSDAA